MLAVVPNGVVVSMCSQYSTSKALVLVQSFVFAQNDNLAAKSVQCQHSCQ